MNLSTITLSALLLVSASLAHAQPVPQSFESTPPQVAGYRVGQEDEVRVIVVGEDQFTAVYRVQSDGTILVPLIGSVPAKGMTTPEITEKVRTELIKQQLLRNPQVRVEISKYGSQFVMIQGEVRMPGRIAMTGALTLMEAMIQAGFTTPSAGSSVTIARKSSPDEDAEIITVSLDDLTKGVAGADRPLMGGDIVTVPKVQTFFVRGQVRNVGQQNWEPGLTVIQAITKAGGITDRGRTSGIKIRRVVEGKSKELEVKETDPVQPGDEIIVAPRRL